MNKKNLKTNFYIKYFVYFLIIIFFLVMAFIINEKIFFGFITKNNFIMLNTIKNNYENLGLIKMENDLEIISHMIEKEKINDSDYVNTLLEKISVYIKYNEIINYMIIGTNENKIITYPDWEVPASYDLRLRPWYKAFYTKEKNVVWSERYVNLVTFDNVASIVKVLFKDGEPWGVVAFELKLEKLFENIVDNFKNKNYKIYIADSDNKIILGSENNDLWLKYDRDEGSYSEGNKIITFVKMQENNWKMVLETDKNLYVNEIRIILIFFSLIIFTAFIIYSIIEFGFFSKISGSLDKIISKINYIENGNFGKKITVNKNDLKELKIINDKLEKITDKFSEKHDETIKDTLSGLYNRRFLKHKIKENIINNIKFSVLMMDIDDFKKINDNYGHLYGDMVLIEIGKIIRENLREYDYGCRYGGEEFLIIFEGDNSEEIKNISESIRMDTESKKWEKDIKITISGGLCIYSEEIYSDLITEADKLLYEAKKNGKNRIIIN